MLRQFVGGPPQPKQWGYELGSIKGTLFPLLLRGFRCLGYCGISRPFTGSHRTLPVAAFCSSNESRSEELNLSRLAGGRDTAAEATNLNSAGDLSFQSTTARAYSLRSVQLFKEICQLTQLEADELAEECKTRMIAKPNNCPASWKPTQVASRSTQFPHSAAVFCGIVPVPGVSPLLLLSPNVTTSICGLAATFIEKDTSDVATGTATTSSS
eukprot:GHVS01104245.1.p1 GENE.GHVS01104245.1~~GHVS01104245.1.p1  ORF type:complete len:212 (+),score=20.34 GHVS01104245.1:97-732(+)